jgi:hypothetical protein
MSALARVAEGKTPAAADVQSLVSRGLATTSADGRVEFAESLQQAFKPMADAQLTIAVVTNGGNPADQFFLSETGCARVLAHEAGIAIEPIERGDLARAIAESLHQLLQASEPAPLPDAEAFAKVCELLDVKGLVPETWGGLVLSRSAQAVPAASEPSPEEASLPDEWLMIVRCQGALIWQDPAGGIFGMAENVDDLAELVDSLV